MYAGGAILALDAATRTGVCEGAPGETPRLETVHFAEQTKQRQRKPAARISAAQYRQQVSDKPLSDFDIWARAQVWLSRRIVFAAAAGRPIQLVAIEGLVPQYDKTLQCGIYAVFGAVARNKGIPVITAMPQTWRAVVLGEGKLKTAVAKTRAVAVTAQLGWNPQGHDEAEAACLWLWACTQVAPRQTHRFPLFMRGAA